MGKLILEDLNDQKKNILYILLLAIPAAVVGFAFQMIYDCIGLVVTAGISIVYINCFFRYHAADANADEDDDNLIKILKEKLKVRTKYVEIIIVLFISYIIMSVAFLVDAFDANLIADPNYSFLDHVNQVTIYPLAFMLTAAIVTPILIIKKPGKSIFITLALVSVIIPYGIFLTDFLTDFTSIKQIVIVLPYVALGLTIISYFISMSIAIKKR